MTEMIRVSDFSKWFKERTITDVSLIPTVPAIELSKIKEVVEKMDIYDTATAVDLKTQSATTSCGRFIDADRFLKELEGEK